MRRKATGEPYGQPGNPEHTDNGLMHALDNWMYNAKATVRLKFHDGKLTAIQPSFVVNGESRKTITADDGYENSSLHCDLIPADYVGAARTLGPDSAIIPLP
ncbi:MAG: hypothetical protein R3C56_19575 [Pirellulaceae bacterium]